MKREKEFVESFNKPNEAIKYFEQLLRSISILLFTDDVILLASSPDGLQLLLDGLASFCDPRELVVNLGKTWVMVFNCLTTSHLDFYFQGIEI
ncbi:hypothetical protein, partial [Enterobacter hormaechei]|uniref:hypothetical protein n=1 Tax=Enterobacter hormaechei TaxID=158836 RepID=UPI0023E42CF4